MKRLFIVFAFISVLFSGCGNNDDDIIWDYANHSFIIEIVNKRGCVPAQDDALEYYRTLRFMLDGREAVLGDIDNLSNGLRAMPEFYKGVCVLRNNVDKGLYLCLGEFNPGSSKTFRNFKITFPDGTSHELKFYFLALQNKVKSKFILDGKKCDGMIDYNNYSFVLPADFENNDKPIYHRIKIDLSKQ